MEVSGQFHVPVVLTPGKVPPYPLDRRRCGPLSRSGRYKEGKILALAGIRSPTEVYKPHT
jgi:hypothetical protein